MKEAIQKKEMPGKVKALITLGAKNANQNMSSRHWMSASGIVEDRGQGGPMFAKHVIVLILIILIVIAPKVPYDMVIISNISYKIDSEVNGHS